LSARACPTCRRSFPTEKALSEHHRLVHVLPDLLPSPGRGDPLKNSVFGQLRRFVDGDEIFMTGHQIGAPRHYNRRVIPEWINDNKKVRKFLISVFPKHKANKRQHTQMMLWNAVIHFYFRNRWSARQTEKQCDATLCDLRLGRWHRHKRGKRSPVHWIAQQIQRKAAGLNMDGSRKSAVGRGKFSKPVRVSERHRETNLVWSPRWEAEERAYWLSLFI
jgi:hypothetical protein